MKDAPTSTTTTDEADASRWTSPGDHPIFKNASEADRYNQATGRLTTGTEKVDGLAHLLPNKKGENFGDEYKYRYPTAYGILGPEQVEGHQGPHTIAHVTKRTMVESAKSFDPNFNLHELGHQATLPSAGKSRALAKQRLEEAGIETTKEKDPAIYKRRKILDALYTFHLGRRQDTTLDAEERNTATVKAMELNPLATYALGRSATDDERKGKGERVQGAVESLRQFVNLRKDASEDDLRKISTIDMPAKKNGASVWGDATLGHMRKYARAVGEIALAKAPADDLDIASDAEFSDLDDDEKKEVEKFKKQKFSIPKLSQDQQDKKAERKEAERDAKDDDWGGNSSPESESSTSEPARGVNKRKTLASRNLDSDESESDKSDSSEEMEIIRLKKPSRYHAKKKARKASESESESDDGMN